MRTCAAGPRPPLPPGPYLVVGLGRAGLSAARALAVAAGPAAVMVWDAAADDAQRARAASLRADGIDARLGGDGIDALAGVRSLVKSPGVPPEIPVVAAAVRRGLPVVDEFEIGWSMLAAPTLGITGTKGKSTVAKLCTDIFVAHGLEPVLCGNTEFGPAVGELVGRPAPGWLVAELSSYQLESSRELAVDAAVFTNLSNDHLDRHGTLAAYGAAKRRLFVRGDRCVPVAALNVDDPLGTRLAEEVEARGGRALRYGRAAAADYAIVDCRWDLHRAELELATPTGPVTVGTRLPGLHNARNVAAAVAITDGLGLSRGPTLSALATASGVEGRFEPVDVGRDFDVVVDLAVCPAGIDAALAAARPVAAARGGRVIAVLGLTSRCATLISAEAGAIARRRCDRLILCGSSYRGEPRVPPLVGLKAGAASVPGGEVELVIDRREAIGRALRVARPGDVVALLGRGHIDREATDRRGGFVELDDRQVARELA